MEKINSVSMSKNKELLFIILFYTAAIISVFLLLGMFGSGFQFVDDPDFLHYHVLHEIKGMSFSEVVLTIFKEDLILRVRPVYILLRPAFSLLFGLNLIPLQLIRIAETILTMVVLHVTARRCGNSFWASLGFVLVGMIGYQSCSFWKLGTQEVAATMWFSITLWALTAYLYEKKKTYQIISILSFTIMCGYKENYILLFPFIALYCVFFEETKGSTQITIKGVFQSVKDKLSIWLPYCVIGALFLIFILFHFGKGGDAGESLGILYTVKLYVGNLIESFATDLKWFRRFGLFFIMVLLTYWEDLKKIIPELLLFLVFVLPQFLIYASTGVTERYILPFSIGYAYFFILVPFKKTIFFGVRKKIYTMGIVLLILAHLRIYLREADYFRYRGNGTQQTLDYLAAVSKENESIKILSCISPNQEGDSAIYYNQLLNGYDNVYVWRYQEKMIDICEVKNIYKLYADNGEIDLSPDDMDVIVAYNDDDRRFIYDASELFDTQNYTKYKSGTIDIYVKNTVINDPGIKQVRNLMINF
ncbi:MAG: hypothetical protein K6A38_06885 [Lachnospiraceae bacterium]|nr:hypothetical protein [Lachnospiraceae bacterium]